MSPWAAIDLSSLLDNKIRCLEPSCTEYSLLTHLSINSNNRSSVIGLFTVIVRENRTLPSTSGTAPARYLLSVCDVAAKAVAANISKKNSFFMLYNFLDFRSISQLSKHNSESRLSLKIRH